jgi:hypothetical protein
MPRARPALALLAAAALTLASCGDDDATPVGEDTGTTEDAGTTTTIADDSGVDDGVVPSRVEGCVNLPESPDGIYPVSDAGEVELAVDGDTLSLVEARPADGWTATGDAEDDSSEVEVTFRAGDREVELEAELDDGVLEVEVCDEG